VVDLFGPEGPPTGRNNLAVDSALIVKSTSAVDFFFGRSRFSREETTYVAE
jgi:hypothetical protein